MTDEGIPQGAGLFDPRVSPAADEEIAAPDPESLPEHGANPELLDEGDER